MAPRLPKQAYVDGIIDQNRVILSRAITLIESNLPDDNRLADEVIDALMPHTGKAFRVGITGVPGVGKSTFIENMGEIILKNSRKLAVLAIDPSSQRTKGSILGDKTRMESLVKSSDVFIRPSPTGKALGGVASKTRETMLLCEAAGYDVIFVETVGVGQSEITVKGMVDFFLLLALAGAGDELQGIKKGIIEMADTIAINKADGQNTSAANRAKSDLQSALHLFPVSENGWQPKVLTCSSLERTGLDELWKIILQFKEQMETKGLIEKNRIEQNLEWFEAALSGELLKVFETSTTAQQKLKALRADILNGKIHPKKAALELVANFWAKG